MFIRYLLEKFALAATTTSLVACGYHGEKIGGAEGFFCVPERHRIADFWWIPENSDVDSLGFSFLGCDRAGIEATEFCDLPRAVVSGSAEPRLLNDHIYWKVLKHSASLARLKSEDTASFESIEGKYIIAETQSLGEKRWYVFARDADASGKPGMGLADDDALLMDCSRETGGSRMEFQCSRYFRGKEYSIRYDFHTNDRVPLQDFQRFDAALHSAIEGWRCVD